MNIANTINMICSFIHAIFRNIISQHLIYKGKTLSREEYTKRCAMVAKDCEDSNSNHILIGISTIMLIYLNRLNGIIDSSVIIKCGDASVSGWNEADRILHSIAETGEAWNENDFRLLVTLQYLEHVQKELGIDDLRSIKLMRWSFDLGERLRLNYHTYEDFVTAFSKGKLFDIHMDGN